jgi:hypothetical protein
MSEFFRTSTIWVADFRYEGRPRRWFRSFGPGAEVQDLITSELREMFGSKAQLVAVRPATDEEETLYLRGEVPGNMLCPTGRRA